MNRMKLVRVLLFAVALLASLVVSSGTASATSAYDDTYRTTPTIALSNDGWSPYYTACVREDYTASWKSAMLAAPQMTTPYINSFNEALENGRWGVSGVVSTYYGHAVEGFIVYWTEDTSLQLDWSGAYSGHILGASGGSSFHSVLVRNHNAQTSGSDCSPHVVLGGASMVSTSTDTVNNPDDVRNLFVHTDHPNYPTGYEGALVRTEPPAATYVAMGDSFSSGEGNAPFEYGTDVNGVNECHRSGSAYPNWLVQTPSLNLGSMAFVACSGATTATVLNGGTSVGAWNEPPQIDALSDDTETVTITIGGNDIGFSDFATACVAPSSECDSSTTIYGTTMNKIHNVLPGSLEDVLTEIADRTSDAKVYVIGYPYVTPSSGLDSLPVQCSYLSSPAGDGADSLAARDVVAELNGEIEDAVTGFTNTLSDTGFTYIDPNASVDGSFDSHDLCQGLDSYFHNVAPNDVFGNGYRQKIFHPNVDGQYEYYQIVSGVIALN